MNNNNVRIIAFYLPQYHAIPENDEWWGKGFTEWTNVSKAKPLFRGHYQPRIPADLGFYDLRIPEVRQQQAELAREAGIEGFCYWHYWFDQNRRMMERIFDDVLTCGTPNFPFCLGWANHSWYAKTWNKDVPDRLLCEQKYLGIDDYTAHFKYALKAFKDRRYIKIDGNPVFYIFDPLSLPKEFITCWNTLAKANGFEKICFIGRLSKNELETKIISKGFDFLVTERLGDIYARQPLWNRIIIRALHICVNRPKFCFSYKSAMKYFIDKKIDYKEHIIPAIIPQWDHSPRSGKRGTILRNSTPNLFEKHVKAALDVIKPKKNKILFLKSWNEWAEGNYMEPDLKFGKGYVKALKKALNES